MKSSLLRATILLSAFVLSRLTVSAAEPLRALIITGGCCHDYGNQSGIIAKGVSARANITFDVKYQGGTDRNVKIPVYEKKDWAKAYDIIIHNECFGGVTDVDWVENIAMTHRDTGIAAAVIHCSMHSYRNAKTDEWRKLLGVSSYSHEGHRAVTVENLSPKHPIMKTFPAKWETPKGELYKIEKIWPNTKRLGQAYGKDTKKDHLCIWTNTYGKARVFGTTLGHHNQTMQQDVYLDFLTRGILWACKQLTKKGDPKPGYGLKKK